MPTQNKRNRGQGHAGEPPAPRGRSLRPGSARRQTDRQLETAGLIVIAILILAITILRYWHNINWSAR